MASAIKVRLGHKSKFCAVTSDFSKSPSAICATCEQVRSHEREMFTARPRPYQNCFEVQQGTGWLEMVLSHIKTVYLDDVVFIFNLCFSTLRRCLLLHERTDRRSA